MKVVSFASIAQSWASDDASLLQQRSTHTAQEHVSEKIGTSPIPCTSPVDQCWEYANDGDCQNTWASWMRTHCACACPVPAAPADCGSCLENSFEGGWSPTTQKCYSSCSDAPADDAGCFSRQIHGVDGFSTLGDGSVQLICNTADASLLQQRSTHTVQEHVSEKIGTSPIPCTSPVDQCWEYANDGDCQNTWASWMRTHCACACPAPAAPADCGSCLENSFEGGWSPTTQKCYSSCSDAPADDAGCFSRQIHGVDGFSTLGDGSVQLICNTADASLLQQRSTHTVQEHVSEKIGTSPIPCTSPVDQCWEYANDGDCQNTWASWMRTHCACACPAPAAPADCGSCLENSFEGGWSPMTQKCYSSCSDAPADDAGCFSRQIHGVDGFSTLGDGSVKLICNTADCPPCQAAGNQWWHDPDGHGLCLTKEEVEFHHQEHYLFQETCP